MKIPLFDIDWTLLKGGNKPHAEAYDHALRTVYGLPEASKREINTDGMIDPEILLTVVKLHGVPEEVAKERMPQALAAVESYFSLHEQEGEYISLPGVVELLTELKNRKAIIGLLTGNIEPIGWRKMDLAGLRQYFDFGAFGNLAFTRVDLLPFAKSRAEKLLGSEIPMSAFVIVGDAIRDVMCAKAGGIQVIAVASGNFHEQALKEAGADLVVPSLLERDKVLDFLSVDI